MGLVNRSALKEKFSDVGIRVGADALREFEGVVEVLVEGKISLLKRELLLSGRRVLKKEVVLSKHSSRH